MAWSRWSSWGGRLSPFARSPTSGPTKISDSDFSYITNDDLRRAQQEGSDLTGGSPGPNNRRADSDLSEEELGPERETDVLILRHRRRDLAVHFPAYSIARGELTIGHVREAAAKKTNAPDTRGIKLLHKGKNLKDDTKTCRAESLRDGSEILCAVADLPSTSSGSPNDSESGEDVPDGDDRAAADSDSTPARRKRNRGKKSHRKSKREATASESTLQTPAAPITTSSSSRAPSPKPTTPQGKLGVIEDALKTYRAECERFIAAPPLDPAKRAFDYKRLSETVLTKVLIALDGVETEGDDDARARRKGLVREAQRVLAELDSAK